MSHGWEARRALLRETLDEVQALPAAPVASDFAEIPAVPAVYLLESGDGAPVLLATTQDLRRVLSSRLASSDEESPRKADLRAVSRTLRWRRVYSAFEARWWYYRLARELYPKRYRRLVSFGPAWFLNIDWQARVPEIRVTDKVWEAAGESVGPWLTQTRCVRALEQLWDLFDLCRYPAEVRKTPHGQACAYAEMGRCDAPCDGSVPLETYVQRCREAWAFARGAVRPWIERAKQRMKDAAAAQRYEEAGLLKRQIAAAWKWHDRWLPQTRPVEEWRDLLAIPVPRRRAWRVFLFSRGNLIDGPVLRERDLPESAADWLANTQTQKPESAPPEIRTEQTWLVAHFLRSRGGDASIRLPLSTDRTAEETANILRDELATRRARDDEPRSGGE